MLRGIEFKHERFKTEDNYNLFDGLTNNTIIICSGYKIMDTLADEIVNTVNGKAEYNDYDCDNEDCGNAKIILQFGLQRIIDINGQHITLALEPAIVYKAKNIEDIWFFDWNGGLAGTIYKEFIYPITIFKGSKALWKEGLDEMYKTICNGRYGTYDGRWIDLDGNNCNDYRNCNCK
jgi:hypothetical protein